MKKLNQAVETIQMKGVANSEQEFTFIFNTLKNKVEMQSTGTWTKIPICSI